MKQSSTLFLKLVIVCIGLAVLAACVFGLPILISDISLSGYDPILFGLYVSAVPFFFALYQAIKLLNYIDKIEAFSDSSIKTLRNIKVCAALIAGIFVAGMPYIFYVADKDDAPGVVLIGAVIIFASIVIATFAAVLQKLIRNGVDIKVENDLTV